MRTKIFVSSLALGLLAAASASAKSVFSESYEKEILRRDLTGDDITFCATRAGGNSTRSKMCKVTRLFLQDVYAGLDQGRTPPSADLEYSQNADEDQKIMSRTPLP